MTAAETGVRFAPLLPEHAMQILALYQLGINEGNVIFETPPRSGRRSTRPSCPTTAWSPLDGDRVLGWAAVVPVSDRCATPASSSQP
ncbi:hypothetical protein ABTX35_20180 [Streptomyces sp. NPDC096080]|uniref:hypothetical protein n=1 Tax=Streptomyces sp. NPDC096080 TaxID=3156693 RepID=UPI003324D612